MLRVDKTWKVPDSKIFKIALPTGKFFQLNFGSLAQIPNNLTMAILLLIAPKSRTSFKESNRMHKAPLGA